MQQKTIEKNARKDRKLWTGLYTRKTPTKQEKINKELKKQKTRLKVFRPDSY